MRRAAAACRQSRYLLNSVSSVASVMGLFSCLHRGRATARWLVVLGMCVHFFFFFLSGCAKIARQEIGDRLSGPFSLATAGENLFVLNSAFSAEYENGSLLRFAIDPLTGRLTKKEAVSLPRMGSDMAASSNGRLLAVALSGSSFGLQFFDASSREGVKALGTLGLSLKPGSVIRQLQFFQVPGQTDFFLLGTINPDSQTSKVFVARIASDLGSSRVVLTLPDDLPDAKPADYELGFGAPSYLPEQGVFVAFPRQGAGNQPDFPDAYDFAKNPDTWDGAGDLRLASLVAVDLDAVVAGTSLAMAHAYVPLIYNTSAQISVNEDKNSEANKTLVFQNGFLASHFVNIQDCSKQIAAAGLVAGVGTPLPTDTLLVVDESNNGEVLRFNGFADLKAALKALPADPSLAGDYKTRLIKKNPLSFQMYSRTVGASGIEGIRSSFQRLQTMNTGRMCVPIWTRSEVDRKTVGVEVVRVQLHDGREPTQPLNLINPTPASPALATFGSFLYTASYSYGSVGAFKYDGSNLVPLEP